MKDSCLTIPAKLSAFADPDNSVINLRENNGILNPVGMPSTVVDLPGSLLTSFSHDDGTETLFIVDGLALSAVRGGRVTKIATLPSAPDCAVVDGPMLIVMTDEGPWRACYDIISEQWRELGLNPDFPAVGIEIANEREFRETSGFLDFDDEYSPAGMTMQPGDSRMLNRLLMESYDRLSNSALSQDYYVHPVLAAYRIIGDDGAVLYRSTPVLVSPRGFEIVKPLNARLYTSGGNMSMSSGVDISLTGFRLALRSPAIVDSPWADKAVALELLVTPPLDPVRRSESARVSLGSPDGSIRPFSVRMPLVGEYPSMVQRAFERFDLIAKVAARYTNPFKGGIAPEGGTLIPLPWSYKYNVPYDGRSVQIALAVRSIPETPPFELSLPHTFTAGSAALVGDMAVWGDITPVHALPSGADLLAASTTGGVGWNAVTRVTITSRDGRKEILSRSSGGDDNAPASLWPVVAYPHPDATKMEVRITRTDGIVFTRTFMLAPGPDGTVACSSAVDCTPVAVEDNSTAHEVISPLMERVSSRRPGLIVAASASSPLAPLSQLPVSQGAVTALTAASGSSSAWDFARRHLYAFTSSGIYAVAVNSSMSLASAHIIDSRCVMSRDCVAFSPDGVYAVASGDLLKVTGSRAQTVVRSCGGDAVAWSVSRGELWHVATDGTVRVMNPRSLWYVRKGVVPQSMLSSGSRLYITTGTALLDASVESIGEVDVAWRSRVELPEPYALRHCSRLSCVMSAGRGKLTMNLSGDNGSGHPHNLLSVDFEAPVWNVVTRRILGPARRFLTVSLAGTVDSGALIARFLVDFGDGRRKY